MDRTAQDSACTVEDGYFLARSQAQDGTGMMRFLFIKGQDVTVALPGWQEESVHVN